MNWAVPIPIHRRKAEIGAVQAALKEKQSKAWAVPIPIHRRKAEIGAAQAAFKEKQSKAWAVLMAGGSGTRFWPESRKSLPKQYLKLFSHESLLEQTFHRIRAMIPASRILVFTSRDKAGYTAKLLKIPRTQVIGEPVGRNTAPCAVWAASLVMKKDPGAVLGIFPADHFIKEERSFAEALRAAYTEAEREGMPVTLGIRPVCPHTGYGYLAIGKKISRAGVSVFRLDRFCEKPKPALAKKYFKSGKYLWNAGIFVWRADCLLETARRYLPAVFRPVVRMAAGEVPAGRQKEFFQKVPSISIDYGLMEKIPGQILTIPADMGWNDVGNWAMLKSLLPSDEDGNVTMGNALLVDSSGNFIKSKERLVAVVGLKNHVVVDAGDAVLVCPISETESIRKIVAALEKKKQNCFL